METKCDSNCLNRSMRYECNDDNCKVGSDNCQNRAFQELKWRSSNKNMSRNPEKKDSNMWGVGVEVIKTANRGYGVRAMRSFEPTQAICEYTGEIITQDEADDRMNGEYKGKTVCCSLLCAGLTDQLGLLSDDLSRRTDH
jgi:[histone H3]-lysine4 N-trimethyltransferase ASH1L